MAWLSLVLAGTLLSAGSSIVDKKVLHGQAAHPFACAVSFGIVGFPAALVGLFLLPLPSLPQALTAILAGMLFIPAAWLYFETLKREDVSRVAPLLKLTSLQTLVLGVLFLGERLTGRQLLAFPLLLLGGVLLSIKRNQSNFIPGRSLLRLLLATTLLTINGILLASVYRATSIWVGITWESLGMVPSIVILGLVRGTSGRSWCGETSRHSWSILLGEQTVRFLAQVMTAVAIAHGVPVALVSTLSNASLVWVWLLALLILKEPATSHEMLLKCGGLIGIGLGVYLLL